MPDHFHFLVKQKQSKVLITQEIITKALKDFLISYSKSINEMYDRSGSLFQAKIKRKIITEPGHLTKIIPYIHNNPVRLGLVKKKEDWKFSSYKRYLNNKINMEISDYVYSLFGTKEKFIKYHDECNDFREIREYLF